MRLHIQELLFDFQSDNQAVPYFINMDNQTSVSSALSVFRIIGKGNATIISGVTPEVCCRTWFQPSTAHAQ